ncbi:hypothetical protein [Amycolatopsis keratiniphila]|uniref:hypothetical protein n=1 Tax=Amycolatopsis keratiniphila TaxID=129921 RepID=UPI000A58B3C6|nr:hypothetical protein [Amycolatopsis keratiniphila]
MAERDSWATMNGATRVVDAEDSRVAFGALLQPGATATAKSVGIINSAGSPGLVSATAPTPDVNVKVFAFQAVIPATRGMGPYIATLDADKTLNVLGADPADPSNARRDLIIARQTDTYYADGSTAYTVLRIKGTPAGSPVDPDPTQGGLYPDYLLLARIRIAAGATTVTGAMIDDLRPARVVGLGGVVPVASLTERAALPAVPGLTIYRRDKGWTEVYNSTAGTWQCQGTVTTGALADITHPYTGQLAILTTDNYMYRWTGSAWVVVANVSGTTPGGDWELGDQGIGTPTLLTNWSVVTPPVGLSLAAGVFTVNVPGWWHVTCSVRFNNATADKYVFVAGTGPGNVWGKDSTSAAANSQAIATKKLVAGQQFRCYAYAGSPSTAVHEGAGDDVPGVSAVWLGP